VNLFRQASFLLRISRSHGIMRRYFIVNGFDGALTMLGMLVGFMLADTASLSVMLNACLGAAIALGVSGVSSAYVSEVAERQRELAKLEQAMVSDLQGSHHGDAARWVPLLIALVNGSAPLLISLLILLPIGLAVRGIELPLQALHAAFVMSLILIFLLGVMLGRIASVSYLRSGIRTVLIALVTVFLIYLTVNS
jgi:predicted membrane protein (TIGR00267 family)